MSVDISNFSPLKRHSFFLLKWAYYLFFMGLLASPFVLLGVVLAYGTLYGMVWWWYDIFWLYVWAPEQWYPDWAEPKGNFRYASRETMEALCEYKRRYYHGQRLPARVPQLPHSWDSPYMDGVYFALLGGVVILVGAWLFRKWGEWGLIGGLVKREPFAYIQLKAFVYEGCTLPFLFILSCLLLRYEAIGGGGYGSLMKLCSLQSLQDAVVVAQPLLTWGENLLTNVVPTIPAGGSVETWLGLDPLYTWMVHDSVVGGYLEGSGGLAQSRVFTAQTLPHPLRLTTLPRWEPSLPRSWGESLQELTSGVATRRFESQGVGLDGVAQAPVPFSTIAPTISSSTQTFIGRAGQWLNYYSQHPLQLWAPVSVEVTDGWHSGTGLGSGPPSGSLLNFMTLSNLSLPWRRVLLNQLLPTIPWMWGCAGKYEVWPKTGCLHIVSRYPTACLHVSPRPILLWLFGGSLSNSFAIPSPRTAPVAPLVRAPVVQWNDLFTPKTEELFPLHVMKKFSFRYIHPLRFQTALSIWKDLRQQQQASYSYYHRVVGAFYATPTVPPQIVVGTAIPQGLWRQQSLTQWLLGEGEQGGRSSFVLSGSELRAQLQLQTVRSELIDLRDGEDWAGAAAKSKKLKFRLKTSDLLSIRNPLGIQNPWISGEKGSGFLSDFTKWVVQQLGGQRALPAVGNVAFSPLRLQDVGVGKGTRSWWGAQLLGEGPLSLPSGAGFSEKPYLARADSLRFDVFSDLPKKPQGGAVECFEHPQGRLEALYWYEERVKLQLKAGGYGLPVSGVLFDEKLSGWWYARQYFVYQLWNPLRRWCGVGVPSLMPPLSRSSLSGSDGSFNSQGVGDTTPLAAFGPATGTMSPVSFVRAAEQGVIGWTGGVAPSGVLNLKAGGVVVPDGVLGGVWRLKGLPINWEHQLAEQALVLAGRGDQQEYRYVPTWVTDWWLGWLPTTYQLSVKWALLLPEWFTGIRVVPPTLLAQVRAAAVERPITWEVWAREYVRPSLWTTLAHTRQDGSIPVSPWGGGYYGFKLGAQPSSWSEIRWDLGERLCSLWWSWAHLSHQLVVTGWACGIDITYLLATEWARNTSWIKMYHLIFDPALVAVQQQLVAALSPLGSKLFYGAAGVGTFGLSLGFNSLLLVVQTGLSLQEYLPSALSSWVGVGVREYLPTPVYYWLVGELPKEKAGGVVTGLLGAEVQFQPSVRTVSLQSFLHHYWMEALLQREGVEGLAQRLLCDPQSWLVAYRGISQDQQFVRLYKLLSAVEGSAKRPLVYREGVPSDRLNYTWLVSQLKENPAGWRVLEETPGEFRFSAASQQYITNHVKTRRVMRFLSVPQGWQEQILFFLDGMKAHSGQLAQKHLAKWRFEKRHFLLGTRAWVSAQPSMSFEFKRSESLLLPRFGHLPQYKDVVVHYRIPRALFQKLYQYEYHHPLTWGMLGRLAPLPVEQSGGGIFKWWWPVRQTLPTFRQAGLPPQHYYTRLETEILGPLLGFLREYNRFAFSSALHDNYYRKYGDIMAYMTFHYPQYTLADIERVTFMPSDFRACAVQGVSATLPLEIQNHFITEPLQFGPFSAAQSRLLTADFANEVRTQAPWLTLMREYFGPVGERQSFWRELVEALATPCGWDIQKGGVYPLSHWLPITLAAEAEEEAHAQLTRRGLKTFLRGGEDDNQRAGKRYVFDRFHVVKAFYDWKRPLEERLVLPRYHGFSRQLKHFGITQGKLGLAEREVLDKYIEKIQKGEGVFGKLEYRGPSPSSPFSKIPAYTLGIDGDYRLFCDEKFTKSMPDSADFMKRLLSTHQGLLLKYPQNPQNGVDYLDGEEICADARAYAPHHRVSNQWEETVRRAYRTTRRGEWWCSSPLWRPQWKKDFSLAAYLTAFHEEACAGPEGHVVRRKLSHFRRNFYSDLFSRLEFQTMLVTPEGPLRWQQEQANYAQSFFAGYHFSSEKEEAVSYPLPDSQSDWAKAYFVKWPARLEPIIKWTKDWAIFLATFDLDQLRRLEGIEDGAKAPASYWGGRHRRGGNFRINHCKVQHFPSFCKQVLSVDAKRWPHLRDDYWDGYGIMSEVDPPNMGIKDSSPYLWQDTYTPKGIWRPRGVTWKGYQRLMYAPYYDKLLPKGTPVRKPWDLSIYYTGIRPRSRRYRAVDWSGVVTVYQWMRNEGRILYTTPKLPPFWWQVDAEYHLGVSTGEDVGFWDGDYSSAEEVRFSFPVRMAISRTEKLPSPHRSPYYQQWTVDETWWRWWRARLWGLREDCVPTVGHSLTKDQSMKAPWFPAFGNARKEDWQPYYFLRPLTDDVPVEFKDYHKVSSPLGEWFVPSQIIAWHLGVGEGVKETGNLPGQFTLATEGVAEENLADTVFPEDLDAQLGVLWPSSTGGEAVEAVKVAEAEAVKVAEAEKVGDVVGDMIIDGYLVAIPTYADERKGRSSFLCHWLSLYTSVRSAQSGMDSWHLPWLRPQWIRASEGRVVTEPLLPYVETGNLVTRELGEAGKWPPVEVKYDPKTKGVFLGAWGELSVLEEQVPSASASAAVVPLPELVEDWGAMGVEDGKEYVEKSTLTEEEVVEKTTSDVEVEERLKLEWLHYAPLPGRGYLTLPELSFFRPYYLLSNGVEYVGRPDAAVAVERANLARLYQRIEGVSMYYNNHQYVSEALARIQIPLGERSVKLTHRMTRQTPLSFYNFPSLRLWRGYNDELGVYYSHSVKRGVPRALQGVIFSGGSGVRFRYPEIFTLDQCRLQQCRAEAAQRSWGTVLWSNFTTLWWGAAQPTQCVRVDPPLYHNLWTHRSEPEALAALHQRVNADDSSILWPAVDGGEGEHTPLRALREGARKDMLTEKEWKSMQSSVTFISTPEAAEKYVALEKQLAVLFRKAEVSGALVGRPRDRLNNQMESASQELSTSIQAELVAAEVAEEKEKGVQFTSASRVRRVRLEEFKVWQVEHEQRLRLRNLEVKLWSNLKDRCRYELFEVYGKVAVRAGLVPEVLPMGEDGLKDEASWWVKVCTWLSSWGVAPIVEAPLCVDYDLEDAVGAEAEDAEQVLSIEPDVWVKGASGVERLDLTYDNYLAVRGPRAVTSGSAQMVYEGKEEFVEEQMANWSEEAYAECRDKWNKDHEGASPKVSLELSDGSLPEDVASKCSGNGLIYPTSFNPFHYYNPYADWRSWWMKTRVRVALDYLRPIWASQASYGGAPITASYERWREFSQASYHQRRGGLVAWPMASDLPLEGGKGGPVTPEQFNVFIRECRRDFLRLCSQWNRLVVLPFEVEQQSVLGQYWSRLYEGLRPENLLRRYVYTQVPYRRGFADYLRYRYALGHPARIDPRCWVDSTLWDEARRSGYCMVDNVKVVYVDRQADPRVFVPPTEPLEVVPKVVTQESAWVEKPALPRFIYPPYYYRPLGGALGCERTKLGVRWEGPGTIISRATCTEEGSVSVPSSGGVKAHECPTQVRAGSALQRFTLPPLKHRSALSYMVDYRAERVWVPERQQYSMHQGWREYVVPNHCGVQGKRTLFWLNRWVGDPVLLRWDWNQEPVGVQAFLFNPKGLKPKGTGFLSL